MMMTTTTQSIGSDAPITNLPHLLETSVKDVLKRDLSFRRRHLPKGSRARYERTIRVNCIAGALFAPEKLTYVPAESPTASHGVCARKVERWRKS